MKSISLILALHNHQPVGNFDHVLEWAYEKSYKPFLDLLEAHPSIPVVIHNTGCLADFLMARHPDYFDRLRALVEAGRLEIMSGGYYEPILPAIPEEDRIGQIRKLSQFVQDTTGFEPQGMWTAERVWEPQLPFAMRQAGMRYTILDDSHFFASGLEEKDTLGYYLTEDQGSSVAVFPSSEKLRYTIPFADVQETLDWLAQYASEGDSPLAVLGDDGEKFGVWPETYEHVYGDGKKKKGWLEEFFTALEDNADWIRLTTFSKALKAIPPLGRIYLPAASYVEMMTWALPEKKQRLFDDFRHELKDREDFKTIEPFVRGGFWRNFLAKYEESNHMHKRMLRASAAAAEALKKNHRKPERREALERAQDLVWQAQCNCAYWHGVFGGLYLPHLRSAVYERLIGAEAILRENGEKPRTKVERVDFDCDGADEIFVETPALTLCVKPSMGGALAEIDDLRSRVNLTDTLTRRKEAYHEKVARAVLWEEKPETANGEAPAEEEEKAAESIHDIVRAKEPDLEKRLIYDWHRRSACLAHFMSGWTKIEDFASGRYNEDGDFVNQPFAIREARVREDGVAEVVLRRKGGLYQGGGVRWMTMTRRILAASDEATFRVVHELENTSSLGAQALFGLEWIVNFLAPAAEDRYVFINGRTLEEPSVGAIAEDKWVETFGMADEWRDLRVEFRLGKPARLWRLPIETVSLSEAGFERVHQGTVLMPLWPLNLTPGEKASFEIEVRCGKAK